MNRFVVKRSLLFFIAVWTIAGALFADGVNLDDMFPSNYVVHDDDDDPLTVEYSTCTPFHASSGPEHQGVPKKQNPSSSDSHLQIVFDQDSPSLASDPLATQLTDSIFFVDAQNPGVHQFSSSEPLHLLLHVLLI